jgi:hypothetical protein
MPAPFILVLCSVSLEILILAFAIQQARCSSLLVLSRAEVRVPPFVKHILNPLHVYCRLRDIGLPRGPACFLCKFYERIIFRKYIMKDLGCWPTADRPST